MCAPSSSYQTNIFALDELGEAERCDSLVLDVGGLRMGIDQRQVKHPLLERKLPKMVEAGPVEGARQVRVCGG